MSAPEGAPALPVRDEADVAAVARRARELATASGLRPTAAVQLATAASEVATNALRHAGGGEAEVRRTDLGVELVVRDRGPGIADVRLALQDGFSTRASLGLGLPGARRLSDTFSVIAREGGGTEVRLAKHLAPRSDEPATMEHAVARRGSGWVAVTEAGGREEMLAVARATDEAQVRGASPDALLALGVPVVSAAFHPLDGRIGWLATGGTRAALLRVRGGRASVVAVPPVGGRAANAVAVLRDDLLVLTSGAVDIDPDGPTDPSALATALLARLAGSGLVLVARFGRGAGESRRAPLG